MRCRRLRGLAPLLFLSCAPLAAQVAPQSHASELGKKARVDPRFWIVPATVPLAELPAALAADAAPAWAEFRHAAGGTWSAFVDPRSGRIDSAEGSGVPWVPGRGNGLSSAPPDTLPYLESRARDLLARLGPALGVHPRELTLHAARSGPAGDHLWLVDFDVVRDGLAVDGARVFFRVNNGNLVQLGAVAVPAPGTPTPRFAVTREAATAAVAAYVGGFGPGDLLLDPGSPHLLPTNPEPDAAVPQARRGYGLAAVWELRFRRAGETATWQARVDAGSGEVVELYDVNRYARASGGIYPGTPGTAGEIVLPLGFVDLSTGGYANGAGAYPYAGGPLSSRLDGRYVRINDACGPISLAAGRRGDLAFGTSAGTDCATPGAGGAGNTHASRTQYYQVQRAKDAAAGWLPGIAWLGDRLQLNLNYPDVCNAFWDGSQITFFKSGGGCGNTGEIADVGLHEFGHGLDANDGIEPDPFEFGTGETYGDLTAALATRDSCIGEGFFGDGTCDGYGDPCTECTGVRDIDWAEHAGGAPHTVANFTQPLCPEAPEFAPFYVGPCGAHALSRGEQSKSREGHCESYVSSEALWDFVARDLPDAGSAAAWAVLERLWYRTRATAAHAFTCDTSTPVWTSHGCAADSYWRALRAADDDDGNLANGTPHSCRLFAAFDRHGIACPADPAADVCHAACAPPAPPTLSTTIDDALVRLAWTDSGPGVVYDLYRGERGCDAGMVKIAAGLTAAGYDDAEVANFFTYSYRVVAHPAGNEACAAPPSSCVEARPAPCVTPGPPADLTAATPEDNEVLLSWSNGAPPAARFNVYRVRGACADLSADALLAEGLTAASYLDAGVSGTLTYAYGVTATDATGICESSPVCVEATATGPCTAPPEFAGLAAVTDPRAHQCTLELDWPPAAALCGGPASYDVHRGPTPDFTPTPANRIAADLTATSYADSGALADGQSAFYVVRARDLANGAQEQNLVHAGAAPSGPSVLSNFVETFEGPGGFDHPGWERARTVSNPTDPGPEWTWVPGPDGASVWFADEHPTSPSGKLLISPPFGIGPQTTLSFWHRFALQADPAHCVDGGTLELSTDGGAAWSVVPQAAFRAGGFTNPVLAARNPLEGSFAWCGEPMGAMSRVEVDLSAFAGTAEARLRWYEADDDSGAAAEPNGWYVDSVTIAKREEIAACTAAPGPLAFHTAPPCRLLDTRDAAAPLGGPALAPAQRREFAVAELCGIPLGARALAANVTVTAAERPGHLQLYPAHLRHPPSTSVINFDRHQTRGNNMLLGLSSDGAGRFVVVNGSAGGVHVIVDVVGWFR